MRSFGKLAEVIDDVLLLEDCVWFAAVESCVHLEVGNPIDCSREVTVPVRLPARRSRSSRWRVRSPQSSFSIASRSARAAAASADSTRKSYCRCPLVPQVVESPDEVPAASIFALDRVVELPCQLSRALTDHETLQ